MAGVTASVEGPERELKRQRVGGDHLLDDDDDLPFTDNSLLCFSMGKLSGFDRSMFAVDIRGGRLHEVQRLNGADIVSKRSLHHAAADSKIYLIGGSLDVLYCEVSCDPRREGDGLRCDGWREGPSLLAPKPDPLVATVNGKVYALAGLWCHVRGGGFSNPVFEVLDPKIGNWESLPEPPFVRLYPSGGPIIKCFAVVGHTIFMYIDHGYGSGKSKFYSFDTYHTTWKSHGEFIDTDFPYDYDSAEELIARNLQRYRWVFFLGTADVSENNMMFHCLLDNEGGLTVYAVDLADKKEKIGEDEDDDEWQPLVFLSVYGFDGVTGSLPYSALHGFVAHVVKNLFCLVLLYFDQAREMMCARACTFEVIEEEGKSTMSGSKRSLLAKNVHFKDLDLGKDVALCFYEWCKVLGPRLV